MDKIMEIGGEFWNVPQSAMAVEFPDMDMQLILSGRTALELVAQDLIAERMIRSVYLPAYCCDSMIRPFQRMGLKLRFYDVLPSSDGVRRVLSERHNCDAVLLLDYFGFSQVETAELAEREKEHGNAVILDRVQSIYSASDAVQYADYTITSWRKWFFSCAASAAKHHGKWLTRPSKPANDCYVSLRRKAARQKADYLERGMGEKKAFLKAFAEAEELLDKDFSDFAADPESVNSLRYIDTDFLKQRRRKNAAVIYEMLNAMGDKRIRTLFQRVDADDVPLFVPVLIDSQIRADLRRFLIQNQVYCPIHWPDPKTGGGAELYARELSLLCDQRYTEVDMEREMNLIKEFFTNHV